jgi:hypothetical protein
MALFIRDLPEFHKDLETYKEKVASIKDKKDREYGEALIADFVIKVEAVDQSVSDMASGFSAVGLQHSTFSKDLKDARLKLHNFCEKFNT